MKNSSKNSLEEFDFYSSNQKKIQLSMKLYYYIIQQVASIVEVDGVGEMLSKVL